MRRRRLFGLLAAAPLIPSLGAPAFARGGVIASGTALIGDGAAEALFPLRRRKKRRRSVSDHPGFGAWAAEQDCRFPDADQLARTLGFEWQIESDEDFGRKFPTEAQLAATLGIGEV